MMRCATLASIAMLVPFSVAMQGHPGTNARNDVVRLKKPLPVCMSFIKRDAIFVVQAKSCTGERWHSGVGISDARISPRGDAIAVTVFSLDSEGDSIRKIAIIGSKESKPRQIVSPNGSNCYGPLWSPDGKYLLFNFWNTDRWSVAIACEDGSGFRVVIDGKPGGMIRAAFWSRDSKSIFAWDLERLYHVALDGKELTRTLLEEMSFKPTAGGGKMELSPDGTRLLIETSVDAPNSKNRHDPPPVVFLYDIASRKLEQLSSKDCLMMQPCWLPNGMSIIFQRNQGNRKQIYRMELASRKIEQIAVEGSEPSLSR